MWEVLHNDGMHPNNTKKAFVLLGCPKGLCCIRVHDIILDHFPHVLFRRAYIRLACVRRESLGRESLRRESLWRECLGRESLRPNLSDESFFDKSFSDNSHWNLSCCRCWLLLLVVGVDCCCYRLMLALCAKLRWVCAQLKLIMLSLLVVVVDCCCCWLLLLIARVIVVVVVVMVVVAVLVVVVVNVFRDCHCCRRTNLNWIWLKINQIIVCKII